MSVEIPLKYGCNPNQDFARIVYEGDGDCPLTIVNGRPSMINVLDGLRSWQLVRELDAATGLPAAASFKHVSPAGAAVDTGALDTDFAKAHFYQDVTALSPIARAYAKARSSDRSASFGDFVAVSQEVDVSLAALLKTEVSDGIIAPSYAPEALEILKGKKKGNYVILQMNADYQPPAVESRVDFGLRLEQTFNDLRITSDMFTQSITSNNKNLTDNALLSMVVASVTAKHTQSNTIVVAQDGHAIGVGAGQQSRIACTRLACDKADRWLLKQHPKSLALDIDANLPKAEQVNILEMFVRYHELNQAEQAQLARSVNGEVVPMNAAEREAFLSNFGDVVLSSDAFIPFRDNLDRAVASGIRFVCHAGGSARDQIVVDAANDHDMVLCATGARLFLH